MSGVGSESAQNRGPSATHTMTRTAPKTAKTASGAPKKTRGGAAGKKPRGGPSKMEKLATAAIKEAASKFDGSFTREQTKGLGQTFLITMITNLFSATVDEMFAARAAAAAAAQPAPTGSNPAEEVEPEPEPEAEAAEEAEPEVAEEAEPEAEAAEVAEEAEPEAEEAEAAQDGEESVSELDSDERGTGRGALLKFGEKWSTARGRGGGAGTGCRTGRHGGHVAWQKREATWRGMGHPGAIRRRGGIRRGGIRGARRDFSWGGRPVPEHLRRGRQGEEGVAPFLAHRCVSPVVCDRGPRSG